MLGFKILVAIAILTLMLTGGMAFAKSLSETDEEVKGFLGGAEDVVNDISEEVKEGVGKKSTSFENDSENNTATSNSGVEKVTLKAQLKPTGLLDGWYDIKKFRLGVSEGSEICPSNNCEYRTEGGKIWTIGDSGSYHATGKLKVTIPGDGSSKSTLYPLGLTMDKTGEVEADGNTLEEFDGTFEIGPRITYTITNATLEVGKNPTLTIEAER